LEQVDVAVVGAGIVGAAVAFDLAAMGIDVTVLEAASEPAAGATRSNSGVIHTGFDSEPGTLETEMIRAQAARWTEIFDTLKIPYRIQGALLVASTGEETSRLPDIAKNAEQNGVEVKLLDRPDVRKLDPRVAASGGLLIPGEAITDPYGVVRRLLAAGPDTRLRWPVERVETNGEGVVVSGPAGEIASGFVVNCAGLYADEVAGDDSFSISARRGEFVVFEKGTANLVNHILLPSPSQRTKGALVFPTLYGHLCAGPSAVDQDSKEDWRPRREELALVRESATKMLPALKDLTPVDSWAGLRPVGHPHNYLVQFSERIPAMLHVAGIRSTGLSAALGLSELVVKMLGERGLNGQRRQRASLPSLEDSQVIPWWERLNTLRNVEGSC
jgi:glycerol-3-phosphate dehydrogenase